MSPESKLYIKVSEVPQVCSISRAAAFAAAKSGELPTVTIAGVRLVPVEALKKLGK